MAELIANWMAASGERWDFAARRELRKFVGMFPVSDLRRLKPQFFVTQHMKLDALWAFHFLDASVHVKGIRT